MSLYFLQYNNMCTTILGPDHLQVSEARILIPKPIYCLMMLLLRNARYTSTNNDYSRQMILIKTIECTKYIVY